MTLCKRHRAAKAAWDRKRARRRKALFAQVERSAEGTRGNARWPFFQGACWTCGEVFVRRGVSTPYCSKRCNPKGAHRGWIKQSVRVSIYDRDGWVCQICSEPVDPSLDHADDMAASLDHIVPRSLTLTPDDSPSNLRLAHRRCNSVRGNRVVLAA